MPALTFDFARVPLGNDEVDGRCEVSFDGPSGGWLIEQIWALDRDGEEVPLDPRYNSFREVRRALYEHRGEHIDDAVREMLSEAA
jgi:hypothetical protein